VGVALWPIGGVGAEARERAGARPWARPSKFKDLNLSLPESNLVIDKFKCPELQNSQHFVRW
jgi:hypothetical protein